MRERPAACGLGVGMSVVWIASTEATVGEPNGQRAEPLAAERGSRTAAGANVRWHCAGDGARVGSVTMEIKRSRLADALGGMAFVAATGALSQVRDVFESVTGIKVNA